MAINYNLNYGTCGTRSTTDCADKFGCPTNRSPDFIIKRHDTQPPFKVAISDCNGPMDFSGLVVEVNMWCLAKLKDAIDETIEYFRLADDIGFQQIMIGDIILMDQVRMPEKMLVIGFDQNNKLVRVQRGYHGTNPQKYKNGSALRIFKIINGQANSEMVFEDSVNVEGVTQKDVLQESYLLYDWQPEDTCMPGCYYLEFKVIKMIDVVWFLPGGSWLGDIYQSTDGFFYTGLANSDSTVKLSYDQILGKYLLPSTPWSGEIHLYLDDNYYTGSSHDNGSVVLDKTGKPSANNVSYDSNGILSINSISIIPSFTSEELTPADYGCVLTEGVEWIRRFPISDEGYLVRIDFSPTTEF
jgi:hypothetical protein